MRHFCSLFNSVYQYHARLLYESITEHEEINNLQFYFFCFDDESALYFKNINLQHVHVITLSQLEAHLPQLAQVKSKRNLAEYFFTATPAICKYVFDNFPLADEVVYLDADLYFFQSPEIVFSEISDSSISIIPHRFNWLNYYKNVFGYYNVGWNSFKRNEEGLACLNQWLTNTIDWCYDRLTMKRYADQKYLNEWKKQFSQVCVIQNVGANAAPWNIGNYKVHEQDGKLYVNKFPLVFYHFASLKHIDGAYFTTISTYLAKVQPEVAELIYKPYIKKLHRLGYVPKQSIRLNKNGLVTRMRNIIREVCNDRVTVE